MHTYRVPLVRNLSVRQSIWYSDDVSSSLSKTLSWDDHVSVSLKRVVVIA